MQIRNQVKYRYTQIYLQIKIILRPYLILIVLLTSRIVLMN